MANIDQAAQAVNAALDKITQAGGDQQKVQQAVTEAKQKVTELVQAAQAQHGQGAETGQRRG
jgi:hypothetical protein